MFGYRAFSERLAHRRLAATASARAVQTRTAHLRPPSVPRRFLETVLDLSPNRRPSRAAIARAQQESDAVTALAEGEADPLDDANVAVLVCHGMGQQLPFETLDLAASALRTAEVHYHGVDPPLTAKLVKLAPDADPMPRAALRLTDKGGTSRNVHLYEVYWAPLTEGKATIGDVAGFLLDAGRNGFWHSIGSGAFQRFIFQQLRTFLVRREATALSFAGLFLLFLSLVILNATVVAVAATRTLFGFAGSWPTRALFHDLTIDLFLALVTMLVVGAGTYGVFRVRGGQDRPFLDPSPPVTRWTSAGWWLVRIGLVGLCCVGALILLHLIRAQVGATGGWWHAASDALRALTTVDLVAWVLPARLWLASPGGVWLKWPLLTLLWVVALYASNEIRLLLTQYMGDVAAYVSAYSLNKFWDVRQSIKTLALKLGTTVYDARLPNPAAPATMPGGAPEPKGAFRYDQVILVAHSLGSVIAYDLLNALLVQDQQGASRTIRDRTKLFLTFGSPLDKTAYIFETQHPSEADAHEQLAQAVQPLVQSYDQRPDRWINIYSPNDWISGHLDYYDVPPPVDAGGVPIPGAPRVGGSRRIDNREDAYAATPLLAHNEYWANDLFIQTLYDAVTAP